MRYIHVQPHAEKPLIYGLLKVNAGISMTLHPADAQILPAFSVFKNFKKKLFYFEYLKKKKNTKILSNYIFRDF